MSRTIGQDGGSPLQRHAQLALNVAGQRQICFVPGWGTDALKFALQDLRQRLVVIGSRVAARTVSWARVSVAIAAPSAARRTRPSMLLTRAPVSSRTKYCTLV